jgi:hypothetical protein
LVRGSIDDNNSAAQNLYSDQLVVLLRQETYYTPSSPAHPPSFHYSNNWRNTIARWSFRVIDHVGLDREIISSGMSLLDRFLATATAANSDKISAVYHQLVAMTCLYVAMKLHSDNARYGSSRRRRNMISLAEYCALSQGRFSPKDLIDMESTILVALTVIN